MLPRMRFEVGGHGLGETVGGPGCGHTRRERPTARCILWSGGDHSEVGVFKPEVAIVLNWRWLLKPARLKCGGHHLQELLLVGVVRCGVLAHLRTGPSHQRQTPGPFYHRGIPLCPIQQHRPETAGRRGKRREAPDRVDGGSTGGWRSGEGVKGGRGAPFVLLLRLVRCCNLYEI